jgi:quercetin dioxygenase-like cupin family protein
VKEKKNPIAKAQPLRMVDLASYQEESIVSRTLISSKTGTVTFFAFDEGQELSEHTAPYDALVQVLDGEVEITISGKTIQAKEGQIVVIPSNSPHALKAVSKSKMLLIMIRS